MHRLTGLPDDGEISDESRHLQAQQGECRALVNLVGIVRHADVRPEVAIHHGYPPIELYRLNSNHMTPYPACESRHAGFAQAFGTREVTPPYDFHHRWRSVQAWMR
ncbi:predicted protein [Streptomyces filamentosus NRRL 15998]|uniref:Predicted protein n=1 Tax=Streptomyces filamentosus NRRL 15998 TaxID=457431 RepID=D6AC83_STRFL|nr:predicted protein [Streptomyces filamentosus NRRL 15998]